MTFRGKVILAVLGLFLVLASAVSAYDYASTENIAGLQAAGGIWLQSYYFSNGTVINMTTQVDGAYTTCTNNLGLTKGNTDFAGYTPEFGTCGGKPVYCHTNTTYATPSVFQDPTYCAAGGPIGAGMFSFQIPADGTYTIYGWAKCHGGSFCSPNGIKYESVWRYNATAIPINTTGDNNINGTFLLNYTVVSGTSNYSLNTTFPNMKKGQWISVISDNNFDESYDWGTLQLFVTGPAPIVNPPTGSIITWNPDAANSLVTFNTTWHADGGLANYTFSFDNCTGTMVNDTPVSFTGTDNTTSTIKRTGYTPLCHSRVEVFVYDLLGQLNTSPAIVPPLDLFFPDVTPPQWYQNTSNNTAVNQPTLFSVNWTDNYHLSSYIFEYDNGNGTLVNNSPIAFVGTPTSNFSNVTKTLTTSSGAIVRWRIYANDTSSNWNATPLFSFATTGAVIPLTTFFDSNNVASYMQPSGIMFQAYYFSNGSIINQTVISPINGAQCGGLPTNSIDFCANTSGFTSCANTPVSAHFNASWNSVSANNTYDATYCGASEGARVISMRVPYDGNYQLNGSAICKGGDWCASGDGILYQFVVRDTVGTIVINSTTTKNTTVVAGNSNISLGVQFVGLKAGQYISIVSNLNGNEFYDAVGFNFKVSGYIVIPFTNTGVSQNTTAGGSPTQYNATWNAPNNVSNYTFSFDNGTGTFVNDSSVNFSGTTNTSSVIKIPANNQTIRWQFYAYDVNGTLAVTGIQSYYAPDTTVPQYYYPQVNDTIAGSTITLATLWQNFDMKNATLGFDNCVGSFTNTTQTISGGYVWANFTKTLSSTVNCTVRWQMWGQDDQGITNATPIYSFQTGDNSAPQYGAITISNYNMGQSSTLSAAWTNYALLNWTTEYDNGNGTLVNVSTGGFSGQSNYSNYTVTLNNTPNATIRFRFYAFDTSGMMNATPLQTFQTIDTTTPQVLYPSVNTTQFGQMALFSAIVSNGFILQNATFEFDNGNGTPYNETLTIAAQSGWANFTRLLNATPGSTVRYRWFVYDFQGHANATQQYSFLTLDNQSPTFSVGTWNETLANHWVQFNITAFDNYLLQNYTIQIDNGNGSAYNQSGILGVSSALISINTLLGGAGQVVHWMVWAWDTVGNLGVSAVNSFTIQAPPSLLSATQNTTAGNASVQYSSTWTDSNGLANYTFSWDNGNGTFVNDSAQSLSGTTDSSVTQKFVPTINATIRWYVSACGTSGFCATSPVQSYLSEDLSYPVIENTSVNSTTSNQMALFSAFVSNGFILQNATLEYDNGNGTSYNETLTIALPSGWANFTRLLNATANSTIRYRWFAVDLGGRLTATQVYTFQTINSQPPQYSQVGENTTNMASQAVLYAYWTDFALANWTLEYDGGNGTLTNLTSASFTGQANWSNYTVILNSTPNTLVRFRFYAVDQVGLINATPLQSFQTADTSIPQITSVSANSTIIGQPTLFSAFVSDGYIVQNATFEFDNGNGTPYNQTTTIAAQSGWANFTRILNSTPSTSIHYRWFVSDARGNLNATPQLTLLTAQNTAPQYSAITHNNSGADRMITLSINWNDSYQLANWSYSLDNNTGILLNSTTYAFSGASNSSSISFLSNATPGLIRFTFTATNAYGLSNTTPVQSFQTFDMAAPQYTNGNVTNTTGIGHQAILSVYWHNFALANYTFQINNGTIFNTTGSLTGTDNYSNYTLLLPLAIGQNIAWQVWVWDLEGNLNATPQYNLVTADIDAPQYSAVSANTSGAGIPTVYSASWTDNLALANYTFSFDNRTGTFINTTYNFSGVSNASSVTLIPDFIPGQIRYIFYARDTVGNINSTGIQSYNSYDAHAPQYTTTSRNQTGAGHLTVFSVYWHNLALTNYTFEFDNGNGIPTNTTGTISGTDDFSNATRILSSTVGATIKWRVWASDAAGNINATPQMTFLTTDIDAPTFSGATQNSTVTNQSAQFSITALDNYQLSNYTIELDNGNHTPYNTTGSISGTSASISITDILGAEGEQGYWTVWAWDASGNLASSGQQNFTIGGVPLPPKYVNINLQESLGYTAAVVVKGIAQIGAGTIDATLSKGNDMTGILALGAVIAALGIIVIGAGRLKTGLKRVM